MTTKPKQTFSTDTPTTGSKKATRQSQSDKVNAEVMPESQEQETELAAESEQEQVVVDADSNQLASGMDQIQSIGFFGP
ncbi:MAG: hypothetical protein LBP92_04740 [Deltaproteobacteria bacterium]|jgi:hypothetical protein|nr:hypothetical protein [Deltaproteobacteria bacterium]